MKNINKNWIIYIYVITIITIFLMNIMFISVYITWNIRIYNSIKNYYNIYWINRWLDEEIIVNYLDNPKNLNYINSKYYDKNNFVSRYQDNIEYSMNDWDLLELFFSELDEEYYYNLNNLKYIDIYWNTDINKCDLSISFLKWNKGNINTIKNNKKIIKTDENNVLLYATKDSILSNKIKVYFSTWAYYNSWVLINENFLINDNIINYLSWSLWTDIYDIILWEDLNNLNNSLISIKDNQVTDLEWNFFYADNVLIKNKKNIYNNRYRLTDSFWFIDKNNYDYKILINSIWYCEILIEWLDLTNSTVKIPNNKLKWTINLDLAEWNTKLEIDRNIRVWNNILSNYLYKLY